MGEGRAARPRVGIFFGLWGRREGSARARAGPAVAAVTVLRVRRLAPRLRSCCPLPCRARGVFLAPPELPPPPSPRLLLSQSWVSLALPPPPLPLRSV